MENQPSPNLLFKTQDDLVSSRSVAILFWDEKRLWLGSGGLNCENSVPKFEQESHPDHWGGPIDPKLCGPFSYVHQTWSASKKSHFRTFAPLTPSDNIYPFSIRKIQNTDMDPPPLFCTAYIPYNTKDYTYTNLAHPILCNKQCYMCGIEVITSLQQEGDTTPRG